MQNQLLYIYDAYDVPEKDFKSLALLDKCFNHWLEFPYYPTPIFWYFSSPVLNIPGFSRGGHNVKQKQVEESRKHASNPPRGLFRNQESRSKVLGQDFAGCTLEDDHPANVDSLDFAEPIPSREGKSYFLSSFKVKHMCRKCLTVNHQQLYIKRSVNCARNQI